MEQKQVGLILLLAGRGSRLFEAIHKKKQFYPIKGKELFLYTLENLLKAPFFTHLVLVIDQEEEERVKEALKKIVLPSSLSLSFTYGGNDRNESVHHGLEALKEKLTRKDSVVFIHDSARVLVRESVLEELYQESFTYDALTTAIPVHDSLLKEKDGRIEYVDRKDLYQIQTPQVFNYHKILSLYESGYDPSDTDDFKKAVRASYSCHLVRGDIRTFKITEKDDLEMLEAILS